MSQKGLTGGWTKYGGRREHVIKGNLQATWYCQKCGKEHPADLSPYLKEYFPGEHIRVCATCFHNNS